MNLASYTREKKAMALPEVAPTAEYDRDIQDRDLAEISVLSARFRCAHARLNDIELSLHDSTKSSERLDLLRCLEEARMEYSDARFALSTRDAISSRR